MTATLLACWLTASAFAQTPQPPPPISMQAAESLTLEAATEQLLRRNLAVEAARFEVGVAEAERVGARLRPRPGLTVTAENVKISGDTPFNRLYEVGLTVEQPIELGNRQSLRAEVAERTVTVAEARLTEVLQRRLFDLRRTYYEASLARALHSIARENRENFSELVRFNTVRFEEGYIAEGELIKVRLERIKFDSAVANAALALRQANVRLLELLGESEYERAASLEVITRMEAGRAQLDLAALRQTALANRADIKVAEAQVALTNSISELERSRGKGDVTPYAGYRRVGVDNTVVAGVTVPLPFGNRNQGGVARAVAEERVAEANVRLARNRALAEVESAFRAYETAREQVNVYEAGILRQADESYDIALVAYREGATELIALLDAQRTRSEVRANYYRALFDYYTGIFQLGLATGVEIKP
ncbi:MAG TPA: TolC family protein [Pyrinomonadaceae bacterium]|jgi:cobalt-zinc-cadmium efflux system outer membrane protein